MRGTHARLIVIGSGPAGWAAALYGARAGLAPLVVHGMQPGGQLTMTTEIENYPGVPPGTGGPALMEAMREQALHCGAAEIHDVIAAADLARRPFLLRGDGGEEYLAEAVVIATGARARWLGLPSEAAFLGRGVSGCATCDGFFHRGKPVVVIGGGNTAAEEALHLSGLCAEVTLVHRRGRLRAEPVLQARLRARDNVAFAWDSVVEEILGDGGGVTGVRLRHLPSGDRREIAASGVFVAIGHDPATEVFRAQVPMDGDGYILVEPGTARTAIEGVYAAGDCVDRRYRQAVVAAGMGCMAALDARSFLEGA